MSRNRGAHFFRERLRVSHPFLIRHALASSTDKPLASDAANRISRIVHSYTHSPVPAHRLLVMTLVMACLIVTPAFSTSFFVKPVVRQIFNAGCGTKTGLFAPEGSGDRVLIRVMSTPWAKTYCQSQPPLFQRQPFFKGRDHACKVRRG